MINLNELFPFVVFFIIFPLVFYLSYRNQKKQKEKLKEIGLKLGLQFNDSPDYHQFKTRMQSDPDFNARYGRPDTQGPALKPGYSSIMKKVLSVMTPPALTGKYNGSEVRVTLVRRDKANYTEFRASFSRPLGLGLRITAQNQLFNQLILKFRGQEAAPGNEPFDRKLKVQAEDPLKLKHLLNPERQRMLLDIFGGNPAAIVDDEGITISRRGFMADHVQYRTILDKMTALSADFSRIMI
jgi:hypothetical protein